MSEFYLRPRRGESVFDQATLAAAAAYWDKFPVFRRSDGVIILTPTERYRDSVIRDNAQDEPRYLCCAIALGPTVIAMDTYGSELDIELLNFAAWFQGQFGCRIMDALDQELTLEKFRSEMRIDEP